MCQMEGQPFARVKYISDGAKDHEIPPLMSKVRIAEQASTRRSFSGPFRSKDWEANPVQYKQER